ncbi:hypothetical protein FBEOM_2387 [Fusarium beomiforme]|uniref:Uncharacterized protein n=1 Tax=Fusarium beomiforme TaxID=44412 RepID=A0A9P5E013_9HYPO|nr:hypothetical protein FBEOM_2387 [Fusarium beomiforme]
MASYHFLTSTSSLEDGCPTTLRDRLRDDDTPATSSSIRAIPYQNIYQQVHASLGNRLTASKPENKVVHTTQSNDPAAQLRESYARMGMSLHSSAIEDLIEAHTEVLDKTARFAEKSAQTLSQSKKLYDNIAFPLYATLCHNDEYPQANDVCCATEAEAWEELKKGLDEGSRENGVDEETLKAAEEFKAKAMAIVEEKCRLLDEVDQEFKAEIKVQTLKIMQDLFDD